MAFGVSAARSVQTARRDARPLRVKAEATLWDSAVARRDAISARIKSVLFDEGLQALVVTSHNGVYPPWIRLEAWLPDEMPLQTKEADGTRQLSELNFVVDILPCHRSELITTAQLARAGHAIEADRRPHFSDDQVAEWTRFALNCGPSPSNYHPRRDALLAFFGVLIPPLTPHRNPVAPVFRTGLWGGYGAVVIAVIVNAVVNTAIEPRLTIASLLAFVGLIAAVIALLVAKRRRRVIAVAPEPVVAPRALGLVDSWYVMVTGLGTDYELLRQRLLARFVAAKSFGIDAETETQGFRTPNGYEERERISLTKGQSVIHAFIYPYGSDLFVGWHAHLNWARWGEFLTGVNKCEKDRNIAFHSLRPSFYQPTASDLTELDGLSDYVHRQYERELTAFLGERAIDQKIDFEIVRADRSRVLHSDLHVPEVATPEGYGRWAAIAGRGREWRQASIIEKYQSTETEPPYAHKALSSLRIVPGGMPAFLLLPAIGVALGLAADNLKLAKDLGLMLSPGSIAVGVGLWLYAGASAPMAVLAAVISTLLVPIGHVAVTPLIVEFDHYQPWALILSSAIAPLAWLMGGALASPALRGVDVWVAAVVTYVACEVGVTLAYRGGHLDPALANIAYWAGPALALAMIGRRLARARP